MSSDYFKSNQGDSQYKPSGFQYTDFSTQSSSYNYENDNLYKKQDDSDINFSEFTQKQYPSASDNQNQQSKAIYNQTNQDQYFQTSYNQDQHKRQINNNYQAIVSNYQDQQESKFARSNENTNSLHATKNYQINPSGSRSLQKFTIRDVLQMPVERQEYLKLLSIEDLKQQAQYKAIFQRSNIVLGITDYYQKIVPDKQFARSVSSLKRRKDISQTMYLVSLITYIALLGRLSFFGSSLKNIFKGKSHFFIPFGLTFLIIGQKKRINQNAAQIIYDRNNEKNVDMVLKKFICQANRIQKIQIFGQC